MIDSEANDETVVITPPTASNDFRFDAGGVNMPPSGSMPPGAGEASSSPIRIDDSISSIFMLTKSSISSEVVCVWMMWELSATRLGQTWFNPLLILRDSFDSRNVSG